MSQVFKFDVPEAHIELSVHGIKDTVKVPNTDEVLDFEEKIGKFFSTREVVAHSKAYLMSLGASEDSLSKMDWHTLQNFIKFVNGEKKS